MEKFKENIDYNNFIKNYFKNCKTIHDVQVLSCSFLNKNNHIKKYLEDYLSINKNWETIKHILYKICFDIKLPKCLNCGKELSFSKRNASYCSRKCCNSSKIFLEKKENSILQKYGVKNVQQLDNIKTKTKETIKNKIECDSNYWKIIKEKQKNTLIQKYGSLKDAYEKRNEKTKETCIKKYGVDSVFKLQDVKNKINETLLNKYESLNNYYDDIRLKRYKSNYEKYGYYDKNIENGWNRIQKWKDYVKPLFSHDEYFGGNNQYKWQCVKCGNIFNSKIYSTGHLNEIDRVLPRCLKCYPMNQGISKKEIELLNFCRLFFPDVKSNKKLIYPYEIDILIPEIKLGIEFNGCWYHSKRASNRPNYHLNKTIECNKKGYRLIHIWEDEWDNNKDEIKNKLKIIFENNELLNFNDEILRLDFSWYNNIELKNYELVNIENPTYVIRNNEEVENCGFLVYKKKK